MSTVTFRSDRFRHRGVKRDLTPLPAQVVLRPVGMPHDVGTEHGPYTFDHQIVSELGDVVVVAVRLIGLQHRELRRVRGVDALVAEVAVDLEDALDAADDACA